MIGEVRGQLDAELDAIREAGTFKTERAHLVGTGAARDDRRARGRRSSTSARTTTSGSRTIPRSWRRRTRRWTGGGSGSRRCGSSAARCELHSDLEAALTAFLGTEETILYPSCFDANGGLFETLLTEDDVVVSDALNHASIIDGIRLCKAKRLRYANGDMQELESRLKEAERARRILIATDGVFSMDGYIADLPAICDLADRYRALVMVDDSHAVGVLGAHGRGSPEHHGVTERIDILTGTLGKALGGGGGGYTSGRREIVGLLRQRSRPYLFSNSITPVVAAGSLRAIELLSSSTELVDRLRANTKLFRSLMANTGLDVLPGEGPIVPVMIGDEQRLTPITAAAFEEGLHVVGFSYPVVPLGTARIRTQVSAGHSEEDLRFAADVFARVAAG